MTDPTATLLDPRVLRIWRIRAVLFAAVLSGATIVAGALLAVGGVNSLIAATTSAAVCLLVVVASLTWPKLSYDRWRYGVGEHTLELEHGVVYRTRSSVPWLRIQNVDIEQGPLERRFGIVSLVIRTASAATDGSIPGIAEHEAEALRQLILTRVGGGDAV